MDKINSSKIKAFFIDLDGTLYFKDKAIEGAVKTVDELRSRGLALRFLTNTDSRTNEFMKKRIENFGFNINIDEVFTPVAASLTFLKHQKEKSFFPLVADEIMCEYEKLNINDINPDYVVIGDFKERVSYDMLNKAFRMIAEGAEIIALQKGKFFYSPEGKNLDTGAFVNMFEFAANKTAKVLGKPSEDFFKIALEELKLSPYEIAIVGDDITTDILGAKQLGAFSVLVKTGKYEQKAVEASGIKPDLIIDTISELTLWIK